MTFRGPNFVALIALPAVLAAAAAGNVAAQVGKAEDLAAALGVLGRPCGTVVTVATQAKDDHLVTCSDGNRYRVYLNAERRVVADKKN